MNPTVMKYGARFAVSIAFAVVIGYLIKTEHAIDADIVEHFKPKVLTD